MEKEFYRKLQKEENEFISKYGDKKYSPEVEKELNEILEKWKRNE